MRGRHVAVTTVVLALAAGVASIAVALVHQPDPAVTLQPSGDVVIDVMPGGPSWNDGIRVGHRVIEVDPGQAPDDWALVTTDGDFHYASPTTSHVLALRASFPSAALATLAALIASLTVRRATAFATAFAVLSLVLASHPLSLTGDPLLSTGAMVTAPLVGVAWLGAWRLGPRTLRIGLAVAAAVVVGFWLYSRVADASFFPEAEAARVVAVLITALGVLLFAVPWRAWLRDQPLGRGRAADIAVVSVSVVALVLATVALGVPLLISAAVLVAVLVVYPSVRRLVAGALDRLLFGDVRERASLAAVEEERTRLAADIHDVPLQELAGIIHRLEARGATEEVEVLRGVAAQLRAVTTELRPPVLDDLGLGPALSFLADHANAGGSSPLVVRSIIDRTGIEQHRRLPPDVEVAVFRIVQEAIANAREHSGATTVRLEGEIAPDLVALAVIDDGIGIAPGARRSARERGRLGLASMAARAAAINAALAVDAEQPAGTRISLLWRST